LLNHDYAPFWSNSLINIESRARAEARSGAADRPDIVLNQFGGKRENVGFSHCPGNCVGCNSCAKPAQLRPSVGYVTMRVPHIGLWSNMAAIRGAYYGDLAFLALDENIHEI
jgi:hypothetical protein